MNKNTGKMKYIRLFIQVLSFFNFYSACKVQTQVLDNISIYRDTIDVDGKLISYKRQIFYYGPTGRVEKLKLFDKQGNLKFIREFFYNEKGDCIKIIGRDSEETPIDSSTAEIYNGELVILIPVSLINMCGEPGYVCNYKKNGKKINLIRYSEDSLILYQDKYKYKYKKNK